MEDIEDGEMTANLMDELMEAMTQHDMKSLKPKSATVLEIHIHPGGEMKAVEDPEEEAKEEEEEGEVPMSMIEKMLGKGK